MALLQSSPRTASCQYWHAMNPSAHVVRCACAFPSADQFLQCEEWAGIDGLCSWHWLAVDAGSQQEQTVPEACPESCEVPTCDAAAQPPPLLPPPAPLGNMSNACQGGKVPPPGCSTGGGEGVRRRRILMGGAAKSKKSGTVQERVTPDLPSGSDRKVGLWQVAGCQKS